VVGQYQLLDETMDFRPIGGDQMRLIPRHRNRQRSIPRIAISQAEITADLHYPLAGSRPVRRAVDAARRGGGR